MKELKTELLLKDKKNLEKVALNICLGSMERANTYCEEYFSLLDPILTCLFLTEHFSKMVLAMEKFSFYLTARTKFVVYRCLMKIMTKSFVEPKYLYLLSKLSGDSFFKAPILYQCQSTSSCGENSASSEAFNHFGFCFFKIYELVKVEDYQTISMPDLHMSMEYARLLVMFYPIYMKTLHQLDISKRKRHSFLKESEEIDIFIKNWPELLAEFEIKSRYEGTGEILSKK